MRGVRSPADPDQASATSPADPGRCVLLIFTRHKHVKSHVRLTGLQREPRVDRETGRKRERMRVEGKSEASNAVVRGRPATNLTKKRRDVESMLAQLCASVLR